MLLSEDPPVIQKVEACPRVRGDAGFLPLNVLFSLNAA